MAIKKLHTFFASIDCNIDKILVFFSFIFDGSKYLRLIAHNRCIKCTPSLNFGIHERKGVRCDRYLIGLGGLIALRSTKIIKK